MNSTWIKICGLTRPEDARHAAAEGVAAIGLVQVAASARYVAGAAARQVRELTEREIENLHYSADHYIKVANRHREDRARES